MLGCAWTGCDAGAKQILDMFISFFFVSILAAFPLKD